jgi:hypothetical protein
MLNPRLLWASASGPRSRKNERFGIEALFQDETIAAKILEFKQYR